MGVIGEMLSSFFLTSCISVFDLPSLSLSEVATPSFVLIECLSFSEIAPPLAMIEVLVLGALPTITDVYNSAFFFSTVFVIRGSTSLLASMIEAPWIETCIFLFTRTGFV